MRPTGVEAGACKVPTGVKVMEEMVQRQFY